ncbi:hypothetical protein L1887_05667 [Cichorium endivia]|nr:hypothetical protein L1887_05667 [Cichorium endivia]
MTAGANPVVNMNGPKSNTNGASGSNNDGRSTLPEKFVVVTGFKRDVVISFDWTPDEQSLLEQLLVKLCFSSFQEKEKEKENGKKKRDDNGPSRKQKDRRVCNCIRGLSVNLLEQNAQAMDQISANISAKKNTTSAVEIKHYYGFLFEDLDRIDSGLLEDLDRIE